MRQALRLAKRGSGHTSPNPMVGAVLVRGGTVIGRGWHRKAGGPHGEIEALLDAQRRGNNPRGATLYVTLEPCCTHGRTPPCTDAIKAAGIRRVVVGTTDPNPRHAGRGFRILRRAGLPVASGVLDLECAQLNEAFNHWIVHRTPFVTVKAAMTLDGKIATPGGESKWITGAPARRQGMQLRSASDAILVGINTVLADDPSLTVRTKTADGVWRIEKPLRRVILDSMARTPLSSKVVRDDQAALTTIVVGPKAPRNRVAALARRVSVLTAPISARRAPHSALDLGWLLKRLGSEDVTSLLVEGGGEVNASFLLGGWAHRVAFFYAPKVLGGRDARKAVAGAGISKLSEVLQLEAVRWRRLGEDLYLSARVAAAPKSRRPR